MVAHFALASAYVSSNYVEPGESIDDIDSLIGSEDDVPDPLLTAHRLAKFYVISAGDALKSCCELVGREYPMHVGSAALARTTAEHASKAMYLSDPYAGWKVRVLRAQALFTAASSEYKSSNETGAREMIGSWERWRNRTGELFSGVPRQTAKSNSKLVETYIPHVLAYDELSRPAHGNAVWLTTAVIQEQKGTNYTRCATLRNMQCAIDAGVAAAVGLCQLWQLDLDDVVAAAVGESGAITATWEELASGVDYVRAGVNDLSNHVELDWTLDPQPRR
ncbi:hypothetical protein [Williamsia sp.]|uniref:hypothetical protein n=1 Tax=Williamsia sp. TaxID=1872085 RepID=UPI0025D35695|nr:hypothetical protein [Williamsia sp.]